MYFSGALCASATHEGQSENNDDDCNPFPSQIFQCQQYRMDDYFRCTWCRTTLSHASFIEYSETKKVRNWKWRTAISRWIRQESFQYGLQSIAWKILRPHLITGSRQTLEVCNILKIYVMTWGWAMEVRQIGYIISELEDIRCSSSSH